MPDYPPMSSPNNLLKSNRLRNFHILERGSKKRNEQYLTKLPLDQTLDFRSFEIFKIYELEFPFLGRTMKLIGLPDWQPFVQMIQPICIEYSGAEMHSGIYRHINNEISQQCNIELEAFQTFSWYFILIQHWLLLQFAWRRVKKLAQ